MQNAHAQNKIVKFAFTLHIRENLTRCITIRLIIRLYPGYPLQTGNRHIQPQYQGDLQACKTSSDYMGLRVYSSSSVSGGPAVKVNETVS